MRRGLPTLAAAIPPFSVALTLSGSRKNTTFADPIFLKMKKLTTILAVFAIVSSRAQLDVSQTDTQYLIDFETTLPGINTGTYTGAGFDAQPQNGQIDSDGLIYSGMQNPAAVSWGGTATTGEAASGISGGGRKKTGFGAYNTGDGNTAFGWHSKKNEFDPGIIKLKIVNNTGRTAKHLAVGYDFLHYDQRKTTTDLAVSYSTDDVNYVGIAELSAATQDKADKVWLSEPLQTVITGLNLADGANFFLKFTVTHAGNKGGFRDDIALDDIAITLYDQDYLFDGTNWLPSEPANNALSNVVVRSGQRAVLNNTAVLNQVIIEPGGKLDIQAGLTVNDTLFIEASDDGQGQVRGTVNGTSVFQAYYQSAVPRWFNLGLPVACVIGDLELSNNGLIRTLSETGGNPGPVNIYYYDTDQRNPSTGEGTWQPAATSNDAVNLTGYSLYMGGTFGSLPLTVSATGALNSGKISTAVSSDNGGFNFVNNPYGSAIDFNQLYLDNPIMGATYYILNDETGSYQSYNAVSSTPAANRYLSPGQAFFVVANSHGQLGFNQGQQMLDLEPNQLVRQAATPGVEIMVESSSGHGDHLFVGFHPAATDGFDARLDGRKKFNHGQKVPSIYSILQGEMLAYNFINGQFSSREVPLNLEHQEDDYLTITANPGGLDPAVSVILEDKLTRDMIDLRQQSYTFRHLAANAPDRFVLHLDQSAVNLAEPNQREIDFYTSEGYLWLQGDLSDIDELAIYDLSGKLIKRLSGNPELKDSYIGDLQSGVYVVRLSANGQTIYSAKLPLSR